LHRLCGVFLAAIGADETQIEASFCEAIRIAKEQKSVSLEKRAEATYAEYRRQKASGSGGLGFPTTALVISWNSLAFVERPTAIFFRIGLFKPIDVGATRKGLAGIVKISGLLDASFAAATPGYFERPCMKFTFSEFSEESPHLQLRSSEPEVRCSWF
jgi:hypothetical protein